MFYIYCIDTDDATRLSPTAVSYTASSHVHGKEVEAVCRILQLNLGMKSIETTLLHHFEKITEILHLPIVILA